MIIMCSRKYQGNLPEKFVQHASLVAFKTSDDWYHVYRNRASNETGLVSREMLDDIIDKYYKKEQKITDEGIELIYREHQAILKSQIKRRA